MAEKIYLYPVWVRLWHLLNALMIIALVVTGVSLQYSSPDYALIRFKDAVAIHNIAGITLAINYALFIVFNWITGNYRHYKIEARTLFSDLALQMRYYVFGIFSKSKKPFPVNVNRKFNPLQKFAYVAVMYYLVPVVIVSGLGLLFPEIVPPKMFGVSALHLTDLFHIVGGFFISLFMFIHIYSCTMGDTFGDLYQGMISGYHTMHDDKTEKIS
jgi:thiosulfate reductase cytochrome b subunit